MSTASPITIQAGPRALAEIQKDGFSPQRVNVVVGASGGPKWLSLSRLDQSIFTPTFFERPNPVHFLGSSIGTWRHMCITQQDPLKSYQGFEELYLNYAFDPKASTTEIGEACKQMLLDIMGPHGLHDTLHHPTARSHIMANRCLGLISQEHRGKLMAGMTAAFATNLRGRKYLKKHFERALFYDARTPPPFLSPSGGFKQHNIPLNAENILDSLLASTAIPLVIDGIQDPHGAPKGMYRDGGILDYHFDLPFWPKDGLVLYPHFYETMTPGWFDKALKSRKPNPAHTDNVILISPSKAFVENAPGGKVPDRKDFQKLDNAARIKQWKAFVAETDRVADAYQKSLETHQLADLVQPLA